MTYTDTRDVGRFQKTAILMTQHQGALVECGEIVNTDLKGTEPVSYLTSQDVHAMEAFLGDEVLEIWSVLVMLLRWDMMHHHRVEARFDTRMDHFTSRQIILYWEDVHKVKHQLELRNWVSLSTQTPLTDRIRFILNYYKGKSAGDYPMISRGKQTKNPREMINEIVNTPFYGVMEWL